MRHNFHNLINQSRWAIIAAFNSIGFLVNAKLAAKRRSNQQQQFSLFCRYYQYSPLQLFIAAARLAYCMKSGLSQYILELDR